jgi:hypothetical protein
MTEHGVIWADDQDAFGVNHGQGTLPHSTIKWSSCFLAVVEYSGMAVSKFKSFFLSSLHVV